MEETVRRSSVIPKRIMWARIATEYLVCFLLNVSNYLVSTYFPSTSLNPIVIFSFSVDFQYSRFPSSSYNICPKNYSLIGMSHASSGIFFCILPTIKLFLTRHPEKVSLSLLVPSLYFSSIMLESRVL